MSESSLTNAQQNFLSVFSRTGDVDKALDKIGVEMQHLLTWCQQHKEFDLEYRRIKKFFVTHVKEKCYLMAIQQIHDMLVEGHTTEKHIVQKSTMNGDGDLTGFETTMKTVEKPIPMAVYQYVLQESSLLRAIQQLANEGLLSSDQYKKLINIADDITERSQTIFSNETGGDQMSEAKAIALIKTAIVGTLPQK